MKITPARDGSGQRTGAYVVRTLRALDAELAAAIPRVVASSDPEALHDLRVAIRKLRTLLRLARTVLGRFHTDAVRLAFARIQQATGDLRDEEALAETLAGLDVTEPAFVSWCERRRVRDRTLRSALLKRMRAGELRRPRAMLRALLILPVKPSNDEPLDRFARRSVARAVKQVEALRDVAPSDAHGMHELRIAYKKLRYAIEFLRDALPADLAAIATSATRFQKRLGDIHDLDVAMEAIGRARGLPPRARTLAIASLLEARARRVDKYLGEMAPAYQVPPEGNVPVVGRKVRPPEGLRSGRLPPS